MLTVVAGSPFEVKLGAAPTTGYMWEPVSLPDGVRLLGTDFEQPPNAAIGDGGTQIFHLQTEQPGTFDLQFELRRRWETAPIETHVIQVEAT